jgi:hypothetical protein
LALGEQNVTLKTLEHLSDWLRCMISDLFSGIAAAWAGKTRGHGADPQKHAAAPTY